MKRDCYAIRLVKTEEFCAIVTGRQQYDQQFGLRALERGWASTMLASELSVSGIADASTRTRLSWSQEDRDRDPSLLNLGLACLVASAQAMTGIGPSLSWSLEIHSM